jgi:hypothetical protein
VLAFCCSDKYLKKHQLKDLFWLTVSEGWFHCSGPDEADHRGREHGVEQSCWTQDGPEAEGEAGRGHILHGHISSDLLPPATPHLFVCPLPSNMP